MTSCASGPDDYCLTHDPIRLTGTTISAMTDAEKRQILEINRYGEKRCGWVP